MASIEDLYNKFSVLDDAKEKAGEHEDEYRVILSAVKSSSSNEKRLASQFAARFFKFFPKLADEALQSLLTLCQDPDVTIRKQVIKYVPTICRDCPQYTEQIAHIVTQLMQTTDTTELSIIQMSLVSLFKADPKGAMAGIFSQILEDEGTVRERAIAFLSNKLKLLQAEDHLTKDVEEVFVQHCKKVLIDVTGPEFKTFIRILSSLPSMTTVQGRQNLLDIIVAEADLSCKFDPRSEDCIDRMTACIKEALPLFSKNVQSTKFVEYVCVSVLPVLKDIAWSADEKENKTTRQDVLQLLAEMVVHCGELEKTEQCVLSVYNCLISYMPLPNPDDASTDTTMDFEFSFVECLMFSFHYLARRCPQVLTDKDSAERLKDFHLRVQYMACGVQAHAKAIKASLQAKDVPSVETKQTLAVGLTVTNNLMSLTRDLFHKPPVYKTNVVLSFKKHTHENPGAKPETPPAAAGVKRPSFTPVTFDSSEPPKKTTKLEKSEQKIYAPPGGKFSEKAGTFPGRQGNNQQGGVRGGSRRSGGAKRW